jgi:hypothetical protein
MVFALPVGGNSSSPLPASKMLVLQGFLSRATLHRITVGIVLDKGFLQNDSANRIAPTPKSQDLWTERNDLQYVEQAI